MLGNVLPGLRELRAPLAGGYLWLLLAWMVWGDKLPDKGAEKADPLDRLYRLEPVITSIGLAIVASVAAYIVGSITIDVQTGIGKRISDLVDALVHRTPFGAFPVATGGPALSLTAAGNSMLEQWEHARADELREEFSDEHGEAIVAARQAEELALKKAAAGVGERVSRSTGGGRRALARRVDIEAQEKEKGFRLALAESLSFSAPALGRPPPEVEQAAREYIVSNRDLLKTRLLDLSQPLHSALDRPDAEATFRMALWPPLAALVFYLAVNVSWWWGFAMVLPVLLAWQWISLRRQANTALVAAFVARLSDEVAKTEVRKGTIRNIYTRLRESGYEPPQYLLEYAEKPTRPPPPPSRPSALELRVPDDLGARASDGQSSEVKDSGEPEEQQEPKEQGEPTERPSE